MAQFQTAKIVQNDLPILVAEVQAEYIDTREASNHVFGALARDFGTPNIILMNTKSEKIRGTRRDIVEMAATLDTANLNWRKWEFQG